MNVEVVRWLDAGEPDADGDATYVHLGDDYTFTDGDEQLRVRRYLDDPTIVIFVGITCARLRESALAEAAIQHLSAPDRPDVLCLSGSGAFEPCAMG
jgi:hypothetical protein